MRPSPCSLIAVPFIIACAPVPQPAPSPERVAVETRYGDIIRTTASGPMRAVVDLPPAIVWPTLVAAYADVGIEAKTVDATNGRVGNIKFIMTRKMVGGAVSRYLNCGSTVTGPLADQGRVTASMTTDITPDGKGGTSMVTSIQASARRVDGTSADALDCGSTGELEELLRKAVLLRVSNLR